QIGSFDFFNAAAVTNARRPLRPSRPFCRNTRNQMDTRLLRAARPGLFVKSKYMQSNGHPLVYFVYFDFTKRLGRPQWAVLGRSEPGPAFM
ncbi:hypothetical protein J6590_107677, partial [Homalodisca vitripennis]